MDEGLIAELAGLLDDPERCSASPYARDTHARDESFCPASPPDAVAWPLATAEVSRILAWANQRRVPVTAWGGGSSLEGNPLPVRGGVALDMTRMDAVAELLAADLQVRVQPGIVGDALNRRLARDGLFFPVMPSSSNVATIGGMIANNAGGIHAVKYGGLREHVLQLEAVLADGSVIRTGSRSLKTSAGYNLTNLFIGGEGTLGIVTEAVLRLRGLPEHRAAFLASFGDVRGAADAALDILGGGLEPAALELMDREYVRLVNRVKQLGWPDQPMLLIEFHGARPFGERDQLAAICGGHGGQLVAAATAGHEIRRLWEGRTGVRPAIRSLLPGHGIISGDVGLPISQVPAFVRRVGVVGARLDMPIVAFAHVGDGNLHLWTFYTLGDAGSLARASAAEEELVRYAIDLDGTVTGEHGLGHGYKREFLPIEHPSSIGLMATLKRTLDPNGILNPGKVFPDSWAMPAAPER